MVWRYGAVAFIERLEAAVRLLFVVRGARGDHAARHPRQEPYTGTPLVSICPGALSNERPCRER